MHLYGKEKTEGCGKMWNVESAIGLCCLHHGEEWGGTLHHKALNVPLMHQGRTEYMQHKMSKDVHGDPRLQFNVSLMP